MPSARRVLQFIEGNGGGAITHALSLAKQVDPKRISASVAFFMDGPSVSLARQWGLDARVMPRRFDMDFTLAWRLSRLLKQRQIDILHTHTITGNFYARWATRLIRLRPLLLTTVHSFVIDEMKGATTVTARDWLRYKREILTQGLSRHFVAVSEKIRDRIVESGIPPQRVTVITNGVAVPEESVVERNSDSARREFGLSSEDVLIGIVGRLVPLKNHAFFLRVAERLHTKNPGLKFFIIGDGALLDSLKQMARESGLERSVIFTGWRNDNLRLISALDILVLCSEIEGLNLSLLEAMACGKPAVGSRVNGIADVLVEGKTGFLAPVRDLEAFESRLQLLIKDASLRKRMGNEARDHICRTYSLEVMVAKTMDLYERIAEKAR